MVYKLTLQPTSCGDATVTLDVHGLSHESAVEAAKAYLTMDAVLAERTASAYLVDPATAGIFWSCSVRTKRVVDFLGEVTG